jgi:predicted acyl esterase
MSRVSVVLALLLLLALAPAAHAAAPAWSDYDRPATFGEVTDANVPITMRDGVVLRANVSRPDRPGRYPTLLIQTPYNKDGAVNTAFAGQVSAFVTRGYVVVTADVRGTGASGGTWDSFGEAEQADGPELVEWAAAQPWSTGKVGLYGPSYMGLNQLYTAARRPAHLKAIFPIVPMGDGYRDIVFSGGDLNVSFIPLWLGLVAAGSVTPPTPPVVSAAAGSVPTSASDAPTTPAGVLGAVTGGVASVTSAAQETASAPPSPSDIAGQVTTLGSHATGAAGFDSQVVGDAITGGDTAFDGPFWKTRSPLEVVDRIRVPAFVVGGHHDLFQRGEPLIYERLKQHVNARLLMGPWTHTDASSGAGLPADGVPTPQQIALRWFDHYLGGAQTKIGSIPKVTQYVYGEARYETQADYPDPALTPRVMYLRGGRQLGDDAPTTAQAPQRFVQQPTAGICTQSTSQWTAGLGEQLPCTTDNRADELGSAVYTTPPMTQDLPLSGPVLADLWVTTTAADAAVTVRVTDVSPSGQSTEITTGWLAASLRAVDASRSRFVSGRLIQPWHPFTRESVLPVNAGEPTPLAVEIFPMRATIKAGHALRITVSPSDFPHQLPPLPQLAKGLGGVVSVLTEPGHASSVTLPTLGPCPQGGCAPLPVPNLLRG